MKLQIIYDAAPSCCHVECEEHFNDIILHVHKHFDFDDLVNVLISGIGFMNRKSKNHVK
nr:hypothetical protein LBNOUPBR_LBNOUPBR_CDS_0008 [Gokushovirinae sp.]